jgi:hypothetical protein
MRQIRRHFYGSVFNLSSPQFLLLFWNTRRPRLVNASRVRDGLRTYFCAANLTAR